MRALGLVIVAVVMLLAACAPEDLVRRNSRSLELGMSEAAMLEVMGEPTGVTGSVYASGSTMQYVYRNTWVGHATIYIHTADQKVTSWTVIQ